MFFGEYERTLDHKGRLTIPAHLLSALGTDWQKVMVIKGEQRCLYLYDLQTWQSILEEAARNLDEDESRLFMHHVLSDAYLSDIDSMKRVTLPAPLLQYAGIEKRTIVVGMFNRIEVWSAEEWAAYLDALKEVPIPSIADLSRSRIREVS
jgi:MraZ protein